MKPQLLQIYKLKQISFIGRFMARLMNFKSEIKGVHNIIQVIIHLLNTFPFNKYFEPWFKKKIKKSKIMIVILKILT